MEKIKHTYYPPCSVLEKTEQLPGSIENVKAAGAGGLTGCSKTPINQCQ